MDIAPRLSRKDRLHNNWGWVVVIATWFLYVVIYGVAYTFGLFFVEFQAEFNSSATLTGWVGSIPIAFTLLLAFPLNLAIRRFGYRCVSVVAIVLASSGVVLTSFMPGLYPMYFTYSLVFGVGLGTLTLASVSLIITYFPSRNCLRAISCATSGTSVGMLSFSPVISYLINRLGWRIALRILGGIVFAVGFPCVLTFVAAQSKVANLDIDKNPHRTNAESSKTDETDHPEIDPCESTAQCRSGHVRKLEEVGEVEALGKHKAEKMSLTTGNNEPAPKVVSKRTLLLRHILETMTYPEVWMISIAVIITGVGDCFCYINLVSYMTSVGFSAKDGSIVLSVVGVSCLVGKLFLSIGVEFLPFPTIFMLIGANMVSCAVMAFLLVVRTMIPMLIIASVIGGLIISSTPMLIYTLPQKFFGPTRADPAWSIILLCNGVGFLLGSVVGQSVDRAGTYRGAMLAFVGLYIISSALLILAPLYQRIWAKDRYVVMELHRLSRRTTHRTHKEVVNASTLRANERTEIYERVSTV